MKIKTFYEIINEDLNFNNLVKLGNGTEENVYTDGKYVYKILDDTEFYLKYFSKGLEKIKKLNHPNVVEVFEVFKQNNNIVIKMEMLDEIPKHKLNKDEIEELDHLMYECKDYTSRLDNIVVSHFSEEIQKLFFDVKAGAQNFRMWDMGFHNIMYDSKTKSYKIIDII